MNYRIWLQDEYTKRSRKNKNYSLRAFAQLLQMEASSVSQIISGKRNASEALLRKLCNKLGARPEVVALLVENNKKAGSRSKGLEITAFPEYHQLSVDVFSVIADWYHYAILELTFVKDFKSRSDWMANKLDITKAQASIAVERLCRLGLLNKQGGVFKKTEKFLTNGRQGDTSSAMKCLQKNVLEMGLKAIEEVPQDEKDITSMTFAINTKKMAQAKEKIKNFRREMALLMEDGNQDRVYHLGIQLYPVSKSD